MCIMTLQSVYETSIMRRRRLRRVVDASIDVYDTSIDM